MTRIEIHDECGDLPIPLLDGRLAVDLVLSFKCKDINKKWPIRSKRDLSLKTTNLVEGLKYFECNNNKNFRDSVTKWTAKTHTHAHSIAFEYTALFVL